MRSSSSLVAPLGLSVGLVLTAAPLLAPLPAQLPAALPALFLAPLRAEPLRPKPPASVPLKLDPDATTCTPERISEAFAQHLRPWADQPPEVLNKLRQLQVEMTRASISRCVSLGRLSAEQAAALHSELGLGTPQP